jgi:hypothetical protein
MIALLLSVYGFIGAAFGLLFLDELQRSPRTVKSAIAVNGFVVTGLAFIIWLLLWPFNVARVAFDVFSRKEGKS